MKSRFITWEIILAGLALTVLAIYVANNDHTDSYTESFSLPDAPSLPSTPEVPDVPNPPDPPSTELHLQNLEQLENLQSLKKLEKIDKLDKLKAKLRELSELFNEEQLEQALHNLEQELNNIENSEIQVQLNEDQKITIRKKRDISKGQWTAVNSEEYVYRQQLNPDQLDKLTFSLRSGEFNITGGHTEQPYLALQAKGNIDSPEALSKNIDIEISGHQDATNIEIANQRNSGLFNRINVRAELYIPSATRITASTNGGHIMARQLSNYTKLSTSGGHIKLEEMHGKTAVETKGGHITVKESGGHLSAKTSGGHIKIEQFEGDARANTSGGHLYFEDFRGSLEGSTSGGNIKASILELGGDIHLTTSAGNIKLKLPLDEKAKIKLKGMNTSIASEFSFTGQQQNGLIEGIINSSGSSTSKDENLPMIQASCSFGNVTISPYEQ